VRDRLSSLCVDPRMMLRSAHLRIEGTCASLSVASSPPAPPSLLCRSAHLRFPTSPHPATIQRDGPRLRGEKARRHSSCQCHPKETSLTPQCHLTSVALLAMTRPLPLLLEHRRMPRTTSMTSPPLTPPVMTCLPAPHHFLLRPQRLTHLSVFST